MEAEATSAVIAAQALVPLQGCSSPGQGSTSDDGHLHCGCRWSPNDSSSTMVDIDSLVASMYQNTTSSWQPELDNFYNYSCEVRPNCNSKDATLRNEATRQQTTCSRLQSTSSRINPHRMIGPSPLCIQSFRANSSSATTRDASDESKQTSLERDNSQPTSLRRTYGLPGPMRPAAGSSAGAAGRDIGPAGALLLDPDRQRRDSGVLIEDQDTTGSGNSMLALNIPAIELTSLTRQLDFNSLDRRNAVVRQH